jgi:hypothetical protein
MAAMINAIYQAFGTPWKGAAASLRLLEGDLGEAAQLPAV